MPPLSPNRRRPGRCRSPTPQPGAWTPYWRCSSCPSPICCSGRRKPCGRTLIPTRCNAPRCCRSRPVTAPRIAVIARSPSATRPDWTRNRCYRPPRCWRRRGPPRNRARAGSAWARPGAVPRKRIYRQSWPWCRPSRTSGWKPASRSASSRTARPNSCGRPDWITTTTISTPPRSFTGTSSPPTPIRIGSIPCAKCARPASRCAAAASSAWVKRASTAPG